MSNTYLDRKNSDVPYLFISYSHADKEYLEKLLSALNARGADFWYDREMFEGDDWLERVKNAVFNKNCMGIIYFMSADFVYSDACYEEITLLSELKAAHEKFDYLFVLVGEDGSKPDFESFMESADAYLKAKHKGEARKVNAAMQRIYELFDDADVGRRIRVAAAKSHIADDAVAEKLYTAFKNWGCASEETETLNALVRGELVTKDYRIKTKSKISVDTVRGKAVEWKAFSYNGDTVSAILVTDELYKETCRSLAQSTMDKINLRVNLLSANVDNEEKKKKHFEFDEKFLKCLKRDDKGRALRYLKTFEREKYYLQLREALEKISVTDASDDGYFFVTDGNGDILFADRGSADVYGHVHVDAYASVFPVIDIDYAEYKKYVLENSKA